MSAPQFSIITPSFRGSQWLRLCVASIADQQGVTHEHIVQDAVSDDGTLDWLTKDSRVKAFVEKDNGMYDAINRGFRRANGQFFAYLNCDEQYLPGALKAVADYFEANPQADVVFADSIVTNQRGEYICSRFSLVPQKNELWVRLPILTSGLFVRSRVVIEPGLLFDTRWRALGDFFWVLEMVRHGLRIEVLPRLTSVFTETGDNLCLSPTALRERKEKWQMAPALVRLLRHYYVVRYRLRLAARGSMFQKPFDYSLYTLASPDRRVTHAVTKPTTFWSGRPRQWSPEPSSSVG